MRNRFGEICRWEANPGAEGDLDALHDILNCSSLQGCGECVACSEKALNLFVKAARVCSRADDGGTRG